MKILKQEVLKTFNTRSLPFNLLIVYVVKDIYEEGKLIDSQILTKDGWMVEDPALVEEIEDFLGICVLGEVAS
jgi:hypothetical protein